MMMLRVTSFSSPVSTPTAVGTKPQQTQRKGNVRDFLRRVFETESFQKKLDKQQAGVVLPLSAIAPQVTFTANKPIATPSIETITTLAQEALRRSGLSNKNYHVNVVPIKNAQTPNVTHYDVLVKTKP